MAAGLTPLKKMMKGITIYFYEEWFKDGNTFVKLKGGEGGGGKEIDIGILTNGGDPILLLSSVFRETQVLNSVSLHRPPTSSVMHHLSTSTPPPQSTPSDSLTLQAVIIIPVYHPQSIIPSHHHDWCHSPHTIDRQLPTATITLMPLKTFKQQHERKERTRRKGKTIGSMSTPYTQETWAIHRFTFTALMTERLYRSWSNGPFEDHRVLLRELCGPFGFDHYCRVRFGYDRRAEHLQRG